MDIWFLLVFLFVVVGVILVIDARVDARAARKARPDFGAAASIIVGTLKGSSLLAKRLRSVRWRSASYIRANAGRLLLDADGVHWEPSRLSSLMIPAFVVRWEEISGHTIERGLKVPGRQCAELTFDLIDGTRLFFATRDPLGLAIALDRLRPGS